MQQLLSDVVALLDAALDGVAVYPTPHVGYIPPAIKLPAVGVHDGPELREELPGEGLEARLSLELACYAHAHSPERGHPALLALAGQVRAALEGRPGLERVEWAAWPKTGPDQARAALESLAGMSGPVTVEELAQTFTRANRSRLTELLEALSVIGEVRRLEGGRFVVG